MPDRIKLSIRHVVIAVLWPSFALAAVATGAFFSAFDPHQLLPFGSTAPVSRLAAYSIGFLVFWFYSAVSVAVGLYFVALNEKADADVAAKKAND